jgi:hypothetical protein
MRSERYQVIVGNIGMVLATNNKRHAMKCYREYVAQSKSGVGRAGWESVCVFDEGEIVESFIGRMDAAN